MTRQKELGKRDSSVRPLAHVVPVSVKQHHSQGGSGVVVVESGRLGLK